MAAEPPDVGDARPPQARRALRRGSGWAAVVLLAIAIALVSTRTVGSTFAAGGFTAHNAYKTSTITSGSLTAPTNLQARASGKAIDLTWTRGATSSKTKQIVDRARTEKTTACTTSTPFTTLTANVSKTATTYADAIALTTGTTKAGDWYCFEVTSAYGTSWTKGAASPAHAQAGFVATSVTLSTTLTTTKTAGKIDTATVTVSFNQKIGTTKTALALWKAAPTGVCAYGTHSGSYDLLLGEPKTTCAIGPTGTVTLGVLETSSPLTHTKYYTTVTFTVRNTTTAHSYTITLTFKAATKSGLTTFTGTPTWTFLPGTATTLVLKSSVTSVTVCRSSTVTEGLCRPQVTSSSI